MKRIKWFAVLVLSLVFALAPLSNSVTFVEAVAACSTSSPSSAYSVTVCITSPAGGTSLTGDTSVTATVSVSGTNPGIRRVIFYLNGNYLLTDFQSPYAFTLPTTKWTDGGYTLAASALMRDGFTSSQASEPVTFANGITKPYVNKNTFTPSSGTTPASGSPFVVAAGGDGASGETASTNVSNLINTLQPNLFLYLGDVYEKGSVSEFYNWYGTSATNFGRLRAITNPTVGNHEYEKGAAPGYFDYWNNVPNYYSYNAGGWHFISLNSNSSVVATSATSAQYAWLQQDLAANSQVCTIVYYHHPLYNVGPEGPAASMTDMWKLMAQYGVSIVVNGHDHDYQRWVPLDGNGNPSSTGITEFVAGAAGHGVQTIVNSDARVAYSNSTNPGGFGVLLLKLNSSGASFQYVNTSGSVLDSGVIPCAKSGPDTQAPTVPGGFTASAVSATQVNLSWTASTDNVGVAGYTIYRNAVALATVNGSTYAYSDVSAMPGQTYQYSVDAFDAEGNHSAQTAAISVTMPPMPASITIFPVADTYVSSSSPTSNYGSATTIRLDGSPDLHGYLRFNVQGTAGTPITRATLQLYANNTSSLGISALKVADNTWDENKVTYNNAPALGSLISSSGPFSSGGWVNLDVTGYVIGDGLYSFGLTTPSTTTLSFPSLNSGVNYAQIILSFLAGDFTPPSTPAGLTATATATPLQVSLSWTASTDNVGVTGYTLYRNGTSMATVNGVTTTCIDLVPSPGTYSYTVDAFDAAGNHSAQSTAVSITFADVTPPSVPGNFTAVAASSTQVNLAWTASTDNVGVAGYTVYRDAAVLTSLPASSLSYSDTSVTASTSYTYAVDAFDAAGNHSAATAVISVTTPSLPASLTFTPDADAYVNAQYPDTNYGSSTSLRVDASPIVNSYLRFTVQGLGGRTISRTRLLIYAASSSSQGLTGWSVSDTTWGEKTITYNNAPALGSILGTSPAVTGGTWITLDITGTITSEGTFSFGVSTPGSTAISLASRESGANAPQLIIDLN